MVLPTTWPVFCINTELDHCESPIQQRLSKSRCFPPLGFCFNWKIKHDQTPHGTIHHLNHSDQWMRVPAMRELLDALLLLQHNAHIAAQDLEQLPKCHNHPHRTSVKPQQPKSASHHYLKEMQLEIIAEQLHQSLDGKVQ